MTLATDFIDLAMELCNELGESSSVTFTRKVDASYSVSTLESTETTNITYTAYTAPVPFGNGDTEFNMQEILNYSTLENKQLIYVPGTDINGATIKPVVNDECTIDGKAYRVLMVTPYRTGSVNCAYACLLGV